MGDNDTPTSSGVPRPKKLEAVPVPIDVEPDPVDVTRLPDNPTLRDLYALIDSRVPTEVRERISSMPAAESRPSMPVRAAKATGRWSVLAAALIGLLSVITEVRANFEQYRGPITQMLVVAGRWLDAQEAQRKPQVPVEDAPVLEPAVGP